MSDMFMYHETIGKRYEEKDELDGFRVEATDGQVGSVMDSSDRRGESFIVIDTSHWLFGKKVMLPAGVIERIDYDAKCVFVNRDKDAIKSAPEFDESIYLSPDYHETLARHYGEK